MKDKLTMKIVSQVFHTEHLGYINIISVKHMIIAIIFIKWV